MEPPALSTGRKIAITLAVLTGLVAAAVFAAAQKQRQHSQDTSVLCNIRQLSAVADQYFLENGVSSARLDQLVGPNNYLRGLATVADETYPPVYTRGMTITVTGVAGLRTVTYAP